MCKPYILPYDHAPSFQGHNAFIRYWDKIPGFPSKHKNRQEVDLPHTKTQRIGMALLPGPAHDLRLMIVNPALSHNKEYAILPIVLGSLR